MTRESLVPTTHTRGLAARMIAVARKSSGYDAVPMVRDLEPGQSPALLGLLLDTIAENRTRIPNASPLGGRPTTQPGLTAACERCGAEPGQPCRTPSGWATKMPHSVRIGKRCASCRELIQRDGRADFCAPCSERNRLERDRKCQQRIRARRAAA